MQKDENVSLDTAVDALKQAGVGEDEMAALERKLAPADHDVPAKDNSRTVGFVSAGHESQDDAGRRNVNQEEIELPEESDDEEDVEKVEIAQKDVPSAVFGGLAKKRDDPEKVEDGEEAKAADAHLGALERLKRRKKD